MLTIDKNNRITLTRGDTLTLELTLTNKDGAAYQPDSGDTLRFAVSKGYEGSATYNLAYEQSIPTDTLTFTVPSASTKTLTYGIYNYDIELTHADGAVDTVISSQIEITGEVK